LTKNNLNEKEAISKGRGKWSDPGVPHKDWDCTDIEDLGGLFGKCEMCELQEIRYVHYMKHPDYSKLLGVGCICAGKMEENYSKAKSRDDFMKKRSSKRLRWVNNNCWKISRTGNDWIESDGYIIVMMEQNGFWKGLIKNDNIGFKKWSQRQYKSIEEAKLSAFDYLTKILAEKNV
jgi:hypothetical protein